MSVTIGSGDFACRVRLGWGQLPHGRIRSLQTFVKV
jgi:hypothetical protein